jgi:exodeoxyribonuclease VII large subunit
VLRARFPAARVLLYPTAVQGAAAVPEIVRAIEAASRRQECDVLIVSRGGGSLEDLWCFNDERVARAIAGCRVPTISGVGHEVDVTIADFVADVRAPTPSAAALATVPDKRGWLEMLAQLERRFVGAMGRALRGQGLAVGALAQRLQVSHPGAKLAQHLAPLHHHRAMLAGHAHKALRNRKAERRCDQERVDLHVQQARDHADAIIGMDGRENHMASQSRLHRHLGGFRVTALADHDNIGILTQDGAQAAGKGQADLFVHLHLVNALEAVFHRILDGQHIALLAVSG